MAHPSEPPDDEDVETEDEMIDVALDLLDQAEMSRVWVTELARLCAAFWRAAVDAGVPKGLAADMAETWLSGRMDQEVEE